VERELQRGGAGQRRGEQGGQAVGRHDVETAAGDQGDAGIRRLVRAVQHGPEDRQLAGHVHVRRAGGEARVDHGGGRTDERTGTQRHGRHVVQDGTQAGLVVEVHDGPFHAQLVGERADRHRVAAGDDRAQPPGHGEPGDQVAGIAVRAVDHPPSVHAIKISGSPSTGHPWQRSGVAPYPRSGQRHVMGGLVP
jgi:hypothetical protein